MEQMRELQMFHFEGSVLPVPLESLVCIGLHTQEENPYSPPFHDMIWLVAKLTAVYSIRTRNIEEHSLNIIKV